MTKAVAFSWQKIRNNPDSYPSATKGLPTAQREKQHIMRKGTRSIQLKFILFILIMMSHLPAQATHGMGGEITWTCLPGGQYRFHMKFYRDCNGIPGPASVTLNTTVPAVPTILLNLWAQNDISPDGFSADGTTICPSCVQGNGSSPILGLVEEFVYQSAPVNLPGVPPAGGWMFSWGECCMNGALTNVIGSGVIGFLYRSIMYPFNGNSTQPCFDSSPYFAARPAAIFCTGNEIEIYDNAMDPEQDSLVYSWDTPLTDAGAVLPFAPGYSVTSQLPSPIQNPLNIAAYLDPETGIITFTSFTGGYFVTNMKVTAYKCGIKVAEIFREINVVLSNACLPVSGGSMNEPPEIAAPFINPGTGLQTSYTDTVNFGDTVSFTLFVTDFDVFTNGASQNITLEGSGMQFGLDFTDPDSGCGLPPCATITNGLPVSFAGAGQINFNWVTTCDHVLGINPGCSSNANTYEFFIRANDNYCPANGTTLAVLSITVMGSQTTISASGPSTICYGDTVQLTASGAQTYTWNTGDTSNTITVTQPGTYFVLGATAGQCVGASAITIPQGVINVTASAAQDTICYNWPPVPLTGNPPGGIWTGYGVGGAFFQPMLTGAGTFDLAYTFTDAAGCTGSDTVKMTVNMCTGLEESVSDADVLLYPNPASEISILSINSLQIENISVTIYDIYGKMVKELFKGSTSSEKWELPVGTPELSKGIYLIEIQGTLNAKLKLVKN